MSRVQKTSVWFHIFDIILNIVIIVAIVAIVRTFLVSPFQVEGNSMLDTLENHQYIIINKLAYYIGNPVRGDVVVFRPPNDTSKHYVKRIIGTPGDEVSIRQGKVFLTPVGSETEIELQEAYLNDRNIDKTYKHPPSSGNVERTDYTVPDGEYFLLGDNRMGSLDSRSFQSTGESSTAFVDLSNIKGKVWFVALPIKKIHAIEPPEYGF